MNLLCLCVLVLSAAAGGSPFAFERPHKSPATGISRQIQIGKQHKLDSEVPPPTNQSRQLISDASQTTDSPQETAAVKPREEKSSGFKKHLEMRIPKRDMEVSKMEGERAIDEVRISSTLSEELVVSTAGLNITEKSEELTGTSDIEAPTIDSKSKTSQPSMQNKTRTVETEEGMLRDLAAGEDYVFYQIADGWFKLHRTPAAWADARLVCYDEGAELVSPENDSLLEALTAVLLTSRQPPLHVFTGINDLYAKGFFTSLRGTLLSAMPAHWAPREPDNVNHGANCLVMQRNGLLLDGKCDDVYPYICYKRQKSQINLCGTTDTEYLYDQHTKSCHKIHTKYASWQQAYATCAREGAYLAIMNTELEGKTLASLTKSWAHIGISYWRKDLWMTVHGQTLAEAGFETWATGEPNDVNEERCGCLSENGLLVDIDCEDHELYFICEKSVKM